MGITTVNRNSENKIKQNSHVQVNAIFTVGNNVSNTALGRRADIAPPSPELIAVTRRAGRQ